MSIPSYPWFRVPLKFQNYFHFSRHKAVTAPGNKVTDRVAQVALSTKYREIGVWDPNCCLTSEYLNIYIILILQHTLCCTLYMGTGHHHFWTKPALFISQSSGHLHGNMWAWPTFAYLYCPKLNCSFKSCPGQGPHPIQITRRVGRETFTFH